MVTAIKKDMDIHKKIAISKAVVDVCIVWLVIIFGLHFLHSVRRYVEAKELEARYQYILTSGTLIKIDKQEDKVYLYNPESGTFEMYDPTR